MNQKKKNGRPKCRWVEERETNTENLYSFTESSIVFSGSRFWDNTDGTRYTPPHHEFGVQAVCGERHEYVHTRWTFAEKKKQLVICSDKLEEDRIRKPGTNVTHGTCAWLLLTSRIAAAVLLASDATFLSYALYELILLKFFCVLFSLPFFDS